MKSNFPLFFLFPLLVLACDAADKEKLTQKGTVNGCSVSGVQSAAACFAGNTELIAEGEPSVGIAPAYAAKNAFKQFLTKLEKASLVSTDDDFFSVLHTIENSDYIAVVNVHEDEDQILYFALSNGENQTPVKIEEFNTVDIFDEYPAEVEVLEWTLGLETIDGWHYEEFEEASDQ